MPLCAERTLSPPSALVTPDGYGAGVPVAAGRLQAGMSRPLMTTGSEARAMTTGPAPKA